MSEVAEISQNERLICLPNSVLQDASTNGSEPPRNELVDMASQNIMDLVEVIKRRWAPPGSRERNKVLLYNKGIDPREFSRPPP
jgi:hypothetical protein